MQKHKRNRKQTILLYVTASTDANMRFHDNKLQIAAPVKMQVGRKPTLVHSNINLKYVYNKYKYINNALIKSVRKGNEKFSIFRENKSIKKYLYSKIRHEI